MATISSGMPHQSGSGAPLDGLLPLERNRSILLRTTMAGL